MRFVHMKPVIIYINSSYLKMILKKNESGFGMIVLDKTKKLLYNYYKKKYK